MGRRKYSEEFKAEAVRQVVERGYSVADVAERVGVSAHSLYKWARAARPCQSERQNSELGDARQEIARLKTDLHRAEEERDILKRPPRTLPTSPGKVRVCRRAPTGVPCSDNVQGYANCAKWVLRMEALSGIGQGQRR